jgi:hypothetical protein
MDHQKYPAEPDPLLTGINPPLDPTHGRPRCYGLSLANGACPRPNMHGNIVDVATNAEKGLLAGQRIRGWTNPAEV